MFGAQVLRYSKQLLLYMDYNLNAGKSGRYCVASTSWFIGASGVLVDGISECRGAILTVYLL